jgi:hypothetical protein
MSPKKLRSLQLTDMMRMTVTILHRCQARGERRSAAAGMKMSWKHRLMASLHDQRIAMKRTPSLEEDLSMKTISSLLAGQHLKSALKMTIILDGDPSMEMTPSLLAAMQHLKLAMMTAGKSVAPRETVNFEMMCLLLRRPNSMTMTKSAGDDQSVIARSVTMSL